MESFEDVVVLRLPEESSSPLSQRKLKRLRKASAPRASDQPIAPTLDLDTSTPSPSPSSASEDLPDAREAPALEGSAADAVDAVPGSEHLGKEMASDDELEPLFPDLKDASRGWEPRDMEEREEEEEWLGDSSWGAESGSIGKGGIMDELRKEKSAKKRLNLEGEEDMTEKKKKKKKSKSGELAGQEGRPKGSIREKRRLDKERSNMDQIHAETQRLLHESRDASFKPGPVPVVQKPISSVLEKIRLRKLEVSKKVADALRCLGQLERPNGGTTAVASSRDVRKLEIRSGPDEIKVDSCPRPSAASTPVLLRDWVVSRGSWPRGDWVEEPPVELIQLFHQEAAE